jgi:hypothetical protein
MAITLGEIGEQIHRYFVAVHSASYGYKAPEAYPNAVERWMLAVAYGSKEMADAAISEIEEHFATPVPKHKPSEVCDCRVPGARQGRPYHCAADRS